MKIKHLLIPVFAILFIACQNPETHNADVAIANADTLLSETDFIIGKWGNTKTDSFYIEFTNGGYYKLWIKDQLMLDEDVVYDYNPNLERNYKYHILKSNDTITHYGHIEILHHDSIRIKQYEDFNSNKVQSIATFTRMK